MKIKPFLLAVLLLVVFFGCTNPFMEQFLEPKTVSFDSNGGSSVADQSVYRGQTADEPSPPVKENHTFDGWFVDNETFQNEWDFQTVPAADLTLYAKWTYIPPKEITGIAIASQPNKLLYNHGEALNLSGLEVTLTYDDSTTANVAFANFGAHGITASPANGAILSRTEHNGTTVTISANGQTATTDALTVNLAPIATAAITVTAPVTGQTPVTTATGSGNFLISAVTWSPTDSPFIGSTAYTATVTLMANTDYTFPGTFIATINGEAATFTGTGATVTISYQFAPTEASALIVIEIKMFPIIDVYTHGDSLDLSGMVVTLRYSDFHTEEVQFTDFDTNGITTNPANGAVLSYSDNQNGPNKQRIIVSSGTINGTLLVTVNKAAGAAVIAPTATAVTVNSIIVTAQTAIQSDGTAATIEYAIATTAIPVPTTGWQSGTTFSGLTAGTTYYIFARSAASGNYDAGTAIASAAITTANTVAFTITDAQIEDAAINGSAIVTGIVLSRSGADGLLKTVFLVLEDVSEYETGSWYFNGNQYGVGLSFWLTVDPLQAQYIVNLDIIAKHYLTLIAWKGDTPYSVRIEFEVKP